MSNLKLERTSSAKLDEMLSLQKLAFYRIGLGYDFSSPGSASTSSTIFVPPANNVEIKNNTVKTDLARIRTKLKTLGLRKLTLKA